MLKLPAWARRCITVPSLVAVTFLATATLPLVLLIALFVDVGTRNVRRLPSVRSALFVVSFLLLDVLCVVILGGLVLIRPFIGAPRAQLHLRRLQGFWAYQVLKFSGAYAGVNVLVPDGAEELLDGAPIVFSRHTSYPDAVLPLVLLNRVPGSRTNYVLMRELLLDPSLDICGSWLKNHFVRRGAGTGDIEAAAIEELARERGHPEFGLVIFPEGGLADDAKRAKVLERLAESAPERHRELAGLTRLVAPRSLGSLALLAGAPDADVVTIAHAGLDQASSFAQLWRSIPFTRPVTLEITRHQRASVPTDPDEQILWIDRRWAEMDRWIEDELSETS